VETDLDRDPETGLATFGSLLRALGQLLPSEAAGAGLARLDIDSLGLVNEIFGFAAGDEVVRAVAACVRATVLGSAPGAYVAHEAGGKFAILAPGVTGGEMHDLAEHVRSAVTALPFEGPSVEASVTVSIGVVAAPDDGATWRDLSRRAEEALGVAKRLGRNRVVRLPGEGDTTTPIEARTTGELWRPAFTSGIEPLLLAPGGQRALSLVARTLESDLDVHGLLELVLKIIVGETKAQAGALVLRSPAGEPQLAATVDPGGAGPLDPASRHRAVRAVLEKGDTYLEEGTEGSLCVLAAPIAGSGEVLGAISVERASRLGPFEREARDLLRSFGHLVSGPIRQAVEKRESTRLAPSRSSDRDARRLARFKNIVGRSRVMDELRAALERTAAMDLPVVVHGESGTGKELVARVIHASSSRARGPFVAESCAALSESLLEAELFGFRKGAFTGADRNRAGLFEVAHGGTLFLDEVGDMTPSMQGKLLRVLEDGCVRPLGAEQPRKVDVRVITATNRDLRALVAAGAFRQDLYFRLAVLRIHLAPLHARLEDVPLLVEFLAEKAARDLGRAVPTFSRESLDALMRHPWPGNVRQLENEVRRLVALDIATIAPHHLLPELLSGLAASPAEAALPCGDEALTLGATLLKRTAEDGRQLEDVLDETERRILERALLEAKGNQTEVARRLGLSRSGLVKKLRRYRRVAPEWRAT
jgi:diguanylate cyclase (GGDEF)-like protein